MNSIARYSDNVAKYNETKAFLESMDLAYLTKRKKQLTGIITRAQIEKDMIDNELNARNTKDRNCLS